MITQFELTREDLITQQLFAATQSERIKKKRQRNRLFITILYLILAIIFWISFSIILAFGFIALAIIAYLLYPKWQKYQYQKNYTEFVDENYKNLFGRTVNMDLNRERIILSREKNETKMAIKEIEQIYEIPSAIYLYFSNGTTFIIPKKTTNILEITSDIQEISRQLSIPYTVNNSWKWQ